MVLELVRSSTAAKMETRSGFQREKVTAEKKETRSGLQWEKTTATEKVRRSGERWGKATVLEYERRSEKVWKKSSDSPWEISKAVECENCAGSWEIAMVMGLVKHSVPA